MADILFKADDYIFDVRTVGVLVKDRKILIQRDKYEALSVHMAEKDAAEQQLTEMMDQWEQLGQQIEAANSDS